MEDTKNMRNDTKQSLFRGVWRSDLNLFAAFLVALTILFVPGRVQSSSGKTDILFHEDFKGVERILPGGVKKMYPDSTRWAFTFWPGTQWKDSYGDGTNWLEGNSESQTYVTPFLEKVWGKPVPIALRYDPFTITKEGLRIRAARLTPEQQAAYQVGGHRQFGSGILMSRRHFQYGTFKMVAKMPSAPGTWPAFWLLPVKRVWPPEIDVFEAMAWGPHKTQIHSGMIAAKDKSFGDWFNVPFNPSQGFHEYTLHWTKDTISVSVDGKQLWKKPTPDSMKQPMYMLVNLAVGGKWVYNELGIKPIDGITPDRLKTGSNFITKGMPADFIVKSITVTAAP
jgi:hypothetical protein